MDDKVYTQEVIQENPFPGEPLLVPLGASANPAGTFTPNVSNAKAFPRKKVSTELLSTALNTRSRKILQEFELQQSGGLQIGNFQEGLTGDLRITPNGLTARDIAGLTTFAIDGTTGDAVFKGQIQSGSVITGIIEAGSVISGEVTIDENGRIVLLNSNGAETLKIGHSDSGAVNGIFFPQATEANIYWDTSTNTLAMTSINQNMLLETDSGTFRIFAEGLTTLDFNGGAIIDMGSNSVKFYSGATQIAELLANGNLRIAGTIAQNYVF